MGCRRRHRRAARSAEHAADESPRGLEDLTGSVLTYSTRDGEGDGEVFVMDADGANKRQLTHNNYFDAIPVWSPDGGRVAFNSVRDGDIEIFVMEVDGTNVRQLTHNNYLDWATAWLPGRG